MENKYFRISRLIFAKAIYDVRRLYGSIHQFQKNVYPLAKQQDPDTFRIDFTFRDFALKHKRVTYPAYLWNYKRYTRGYTCWSLFPSNSRKGGMRNGRIMRHIARFESALPNIVGYSGRKSGVYKQGDLFRLTDCALLCATKANKYYRYWILTSPIRSRNAIGH